MRESLLILKVYVCLQISMEIFNQWGKHIVSIDSNDELSYWDGLNTNGNEMNAGVYFYRITYQVNIYSYQKRKR